MSESGRMILDKLEFDGNTVLCRVCGDRASGFHYGVHACEGCKGFFRRSIQQKIQYRPCMKNQQCSIMRINRNRCQYCRLKKCISVGMSRDAVRFGRVPKREKAKIMEQMRQSMLEADLNKVTDLISDQPSFLCSVVEAHLRYSQFTKSSISQLIDEAYDKTDYVDCPTHMACPLSSRYKQESKNSADITEMFTPAIRNIVSFAKDVPGFLQLNQDDQVTLLKSGTFEVLLLQMCRLFDSRLSVLTFADGRLYQRTENTNGCQASFLLDSMFEFADRVNRLDLSDEVIALFSAIIIIASDRPGLRNTVLVQRIEAGLRSGFERLLQAMQPDDPDLFDQIISKIPDLRTLNTLHAEKLMGTIVTETDDSNSRSYGVESHSLSTPSSSAVGSPADMGLGADIGPTAPSSPYFPDEKPVIEAQSSLPLPALIPLDPTTTVGNPQVKQEPLSPVLGTGRWEQTFGSPTRQSPKGKVQSDLISAVPDASPVPREQPVTCPISEEMKQMAYTLPGLTPAHAFTQNRIAAMAQLLGWSQSVNLPTHLLQPGGVNNGMLPAQRGSPPTSVAQPWPMPPGFPFAQLNYLEPPRTRSFSAHFPAKPVFQGMPLPGPAKIPTFQNGYSHYPKHPLLRADLQDEFTGGLTQNEGFRKRSATNEQGLYNHEQLMKKKRLLPPLVNEEMREGRSNSWSATCCSAAQAAATAATAATAASSTFQKPRAGRSPLATQSPLTIDDNGCQITVPPSFREGKATSSAVSSELRQSVLRQALSIPPLQNQESWFHKSSHRRSPLESRPSPAEFPIRSHSFKSALKPPGSKLDALKASLAPTLVANSAPGSASSTRCPTPSLPSFTSSASGPSKTFKLKTALLNRFSPKEHSSETVTSSMTENKADDVESLERDVDWEEEGALVIDTDEQTTSSGEQENCV